MPNIKANKIDLRGKCNSCCVPGCNSNSTPSYRSRGGRITTFKLPKDEARRKEWIKAIPKRKYPPTVNHNVCILHFNEEDFARNNRRIDLKKSAVPSIFPFVSGQEIDENCDISDEIWTEYVTYKSESLNKYDGNINETLSVPDLSRILIERLRIPGAKYFGIDTSEIVNDPVSEYDSDSDVSLNIPAPKKEKKTFKSHKKKKAVADDHNDDIDFVSISNDDCDINYGIDEKANLPDENRNSLNEIYDPKETLQVNDDEEKFGSMVSSKLLLMVPLQRLISEKIISEILLKGQLNMLKKSVQPVMVTGYVKSVANAENSNDVMSSLNNCTDPLMFNVKQELYDAELATNDVKYDE